MKTYAEWKAMGMFVKKGEKSSTRNPEGKALFKREQVRCISDIINMYSPPTFHSQVVGDDLMKVVDMEMASFGFISTDMELWLEGNDVVSQYPDAPEFEDHWTNMRPY